MATIYIEGQEEGGIEIFRQIYAEAMRGEIPMNVDYNPNCSINIEPSNQRESIKHLEQLITPIKGRCGGNIHNDPSITPIKGRMG